MNKLILLCLTLTGCTTTKYVERPAPDYLKTGCEVPRAQPFDEFVKTYPEYNGLDDGSLLADALHLIYIIRRDGVYVRQYSDKLKKTMCECDADMRRFTGEPVSERMAGVCGIESTQ